MSESTRDRRATIYPYVGYNEGGFATAAYGTTRGTFWCRLSPVPGAESILDAQDGIVERATIEFADEVPVAEHDLIVLDDDVQWKAGPITARRAQRALLLQVSRSSEMIELPTAAATPASVGVVDASHADEGFAAPEDETLDGGSASTTTFADTFDAGGA